MSHLAHRIRLLAVTHSLSGGGAERFVATLAGGLDRGRFEVAIASATAGRTYELPADVEVFPLGYRGLASLPGTVWRLRQLVCAWRPDVVLSNVLSTSCLAGAALAGLAPRPRWLVRIGNAPRQADPRWQRAWARWAYRRADLAVANSRGLVPAVEAAYPALAGRVRWVANPTDFTGLGAKAAAPPAVVRSGAGSLLVWMGRLVPQKRPDLLLAAFAQVCRELPARLWICGEGPLASALQAQARELGIADVVDFLGFVGNPFALLSQADLFVLSSDFEGLPNALIEAQGLGLAAVATRCPYGPDEIVVDGETGLLVPPGDAAALAAAALALLRDPARRQRMGEAAQRQARARFAVEPLLGQWQALLETAGARSIS